MGELSGKNALVTDGGTGIGFGIARTLLREGAAVTLAARRLDVLEDAVDRAGPRASAADLNESPT